MLESEKVLVTKDLNTGRIDSCKIVEVIEVIFLRGKGIESDVLRIVTQWRTKTGEFIAEHDPCAPEDTRLRELYVLIGEKTQEIADMKRDRDSQVAETPLERDARMGDPLAIDILNLTKRTT